MRVVVSCSRRFSRTPNGIVWTTSSDDYDFWKRYLSVFDEVLIVGRVQDVQETEAKTFWKPVVGPGVSVHGLPSYIGPIGFLKASMKVFSSIRYVIRGTDAVILRIPGHVVTSLEMLVRSRRQPYGAEVVGGMGSPLAGASAEQILQPMFRLYTKYTLRRQCRNACAISYVTASTLQRYFPPSSSAFVTHYSSIELPDEYVVNKPRVMNDSCVRIISVGSMAMRYKRFDVLIEAVKRCLASGLDLHLTLIGDGRHRPFFEKAAEGLGERVEFLGELPSSDAVRGELLKADLFVSASANEGLPRVVIEAMTVGLPCIGTTVGGTPELLLPEDMVPVGNVEELVKKIQHVVLSPERMNRMSARSLQVAREYTDSVLSKRRQEMYRHVRECTERYIVRT